MFLLYLLDDSLESICIVDCEVSKNLAVNLDAILVESTHELAVAHIVEACCCVDTLNPKSAEVALFVAAVTVCIGETLLVGVLCYCPDVLAGTILPLRLLQNSWSLCF